MKARGNTKKLLLALGEVQDLIGRARGAAMDDRNPNRVEELLKTLDAAFEKCLEAREPYDPI